MTMRTMGWIIIGSIALLASGSVRARERKPAAGTVRQIQDGNDSISAADRKGRAVLEEKLTQLNAPEGGQILAAAQAPLARAFPASRFYVLRYRQYPLARALPEPFQSNNLFVVQPNGTILHLTETKALESFFRSNLAPVKTEAQARDAVRAWLLLSEELLQDGFLQFSLPESAVTASARKGRWEASGKAVVAPRGGDMGEIAASLTFDSRGKLAGAVETARVKAGIRPICQSTKLLDPDPIVRRMAEQDLLVMGRAAKSYLDEQRAKANPALQRAIDRIWQRILDEGR